MSIGTFLRMLPHDLDADSAHGWLTARTVEAYRDEDFAFLPTEERKRLKSNVERFLLEVGTTDVGVAQRPATDDEIARARSPLKEILAIVEPDRYPDAEAQRLGRRIESLVAWKTPASKLPGWVKDLKFETGNDHTGDPAIWIWAISDDAIFDSEDFSKEAAIVRSVLFEAAREAEESKWPFVRLRSVSDERLLLHEGAQ